MKSAWSIKLQIYVRRARIDRELETEVGQPEKKVVLSLLFSLLSGRWAQRDGEKNSNVELLL